MNSTTYSDYVVSVDFLGILSQYGINTMDTESFHHLIQLALEKKPEALVRLQTELDQMTARLKATDKELECSMHNHKRDFELLGKYHKCLAAINKATAELEDN